jgi:hypothetical protein
MIGQIVHSVKDNVSKDFLSGAVHFPGMAKTTPTEAELAFIERTKVARKARFAAAREMAKALGIDKERYAKYETRSPLPHQYVEQFCLIAGVSIEWLFTGQERKRA